MYRDWDCHKDHVLHDGYIGFATCQFLTYCCLLGASASCHVCDKASKFTSDTPKLVTLVLVKAMIYQLLLTL